MHAALVSVPLGSTPPQQGSSRLRRNPSPGVLAFRNTTSSEETQLSTSTSRSYTSYLDSGSWRSPLGRTVSSNGTDSRPPLSHTQSIPKSARFVKVEGFPETSSGSGSHTQSPTVQTLPRAPSLLTRQLSHDNLGVSPPAKSPSTSSLAHLEAAYGASPTVEPKPVTRPLSLPRRPAAPSPSAILAALQNRYPVFWEPLAVRAFHIAFHAHAHDTNIGDAALGEAPFSRAASAAAVLAELGADEVAVAGALLHDVLDRTMLVESQLRTMLGSDETLELVKRVSHLGYVAQKYRASINGGAAASTTSRMSSGAKLTEPNAAATQMVNLMVVNGSPRALLVRLAVALQDARWLDSRGGVAGTPPATAAAREARRLRAATEALDVWAPLANRLGVWSLKAELEDRAFRALHPAEYHELRERLEAAQEPTQLVNIMDRLRSQLQDLGVEYLDLSGRPKHLWGVWQKMRNKGYAGTDRVRDVRGLRVIVRNREDCYRALRAVETAFSVSGTPKNYIKAPKPNGYQSLHAVADPGDGHLVEIQIRTDKMHYLAEYGAEAAHWRYKEGARGTQSGSSGGTAREANWAKYEVSQAVALDKKVRPSGSPSGDQSLASIMAAMDSALLASSASHGDSPTDGAAATAAPSKGRSFEEYIAVSGQHPAPPGESARALVAVVVGGTFSVVELEPGTTLHGLLERCGRPLAPETDGLMIGPLSIVNRQEETDLAAVLQPGDVVELYPAEVPSPRTRTSRPQAPMRGNMVPLGRKLSSTLTLSN
jgi:hypothetical protein